MSVRHPLLVCLNLQRRHVDRRSRFFVPRAPLVLPAIVACMGWARRRDLRVVHVHSLDAQGQGRRPIAGCEPKTSESLIFKRHSSFFLHEEFALGGSFHCSSALVVGFTSDRDCMAAAYDAERSGARVVFVEDAIGASRLGGHAPHLVDAVVAAMLGELAGLVHSSELLAHELAQAFQPAAQLDYGRGSDGN